MKRTLMIMLSLLLGFSFPLAETKSKAVAIATREDLMKIAEAPDGDYVLTADIDLAGDPWVPIPFSGNFDGAGHTIGNLTVCETGAETAKTIDGNRIEYDTVFAGLFSVVTDAEIRDLRLVNAEISIETDQNCFIGAVAGYAENSLIRECTVSVRETLLLSGVNVGVGGVVGYMKASEVYASTVDAELQFIDLNEDVLCEEFLGGVYASGYGTVSTCRVRMRGFADIYGYAHNGGVVGMFKLPRDYKGKHLTVHDTVVDAEISFFEVTPSKRAYCQPFIGENCAQDCYVTSNNELHYKRTYSDTAVSYRPESCESPSYRTVVTEPTCTEWGYTTYTCETCGYTYTDDYKLPQHKYHEDTTPPTCTEGGYTVYTCELCGESHTVTIPPKGHTPGEWVMTREAGPGYEGEEVLSCVDCGAVLETRATPALEIPEPEPVVDESGPTLVQNIRIDEPVIELITGEYRLLQYAIEPADAELGTIRFESSDPSIAKVDYDGYVKALYPGTCTIRVYSTVGSVEAICSVIVTAAPKEETKSLFSWLRCG